MCHIVQNDKLKHLKIVSNLKPLNIQPMLHWLFKKSKNIIIVMDYSPPITFQVQYALCTFYMVDFFTNFSSHETCYKLGV
jgi:hypothetical protein